MRALVTGAAGFVGSHLAEALSARGDDVVGIDVFTDYYDVATKQVNAEKVRAAGAEVVELDLVTAPLVDLLADVDVVFHEAGQPGVRHSWAGGFDDYVTRNVLATQRLLEALRRFPRARLVYASSSSVYGDAMRYPTTEEDLPAPRSPYGVTKLAAEHLVDLYAATWGLHGISLRYFTVYGPRQRPDMAIHRLCEAALGGPPFPRYGDGSQVREFTYVDDIVAGNLAAADADVAPGTVCNLAGGSEITLAALVDLVGELAGTDVPIDARDPRPGDTRRNGGSTELARRLLDWSPRVDLRAGVARQLEWHRARRRDAAGSG